MFDFAFQMGAPAVSGSRNLAVVPCLIKTQGGAWSIVSALISVYSSCQSSVAIFQAAGFPWWVMSVSRQPVDIYTLRRVLNLDI